MWVVAVTKRVIVVGADRPVRHMVEIYRTTDGIHHERHKPAWPAGLATSASARQAIVPGPARPGLTAVMSGLVPRSNRFAPVYPGHARRVINYVVDSFESCSSH